MLRTSMLADPAFSAELLQTVAALFKTREDAIAHCASGGVDVDIEVEARIGRKRGGAFNAGCSAGTMDAMLGKFAQAAPGTFEETDWTESHDTFFPVPGVDFDIRGTTNIHDATLKMESVNVAKSREVTLDVGPLGDADDSSSEWRICLSRERHVPPASLPVVVKPSMVRIKQRKSFRYRNADATVIWRYDFTISWTGADKTETERRQFSDEEPTYEFELELEHAHPDVSLDYLARSLLLKLADHGLVRAPMVLTQQRTAPVPPPLTSRAKRPKWSNAKGGKSRCA